MKRKIRRNKNLTGAGKIFSVGLMFFALIFLTTANFFVKVSPQSKVVTAPVSNTKDDSNEDLPTTPAPTEEKTSSTSLSVVEEYLHKDHFNFDLFNSGKNIQHKIAVSQKIELVHFELLSPPPEV